MSFLTYLANYIFIDVHKKIVRTVYRVIILMSHQLGLIVMMKSMFKPLFGLPGISARITGFVFRVTAVAISLLLLSLAVILGLSIYPILFYILIFETFKHMAFVVVLFSIFVLVKFYDYYKNPRIKLSLVRNIFELSDASNIDDRRFLSSFLAEDYSRLIRLMRLNKDIKSFLYRCELDPESVFDYLDRKKTLFNKDLLFKRIIELEKQTTYNYLSSQLFFTALITTLEDADKFLSKNNFSVKELVYSLRFSDYLHYRDPYLWEDSYVLPPSGGVDKGWATGYSATLNKYSTDYTKLAMKGFMPKLIGRDDVKKEVVSILSKVSRNNVMLIGDPGSGKTTFVQGLAREVATGTSIPALKYKRFVSLDIGALTSGSQGEINDRLTKIIREVEDAGNIILFIDEIHNLSSTLNADPNAVAVFSTLEPHLTSGKFQFIGATSRKNYAKYIRPNESFSKAFDVVELRETTLEETYLVMEEIAKHIESTTSVLITYPAISKAIRLSKRLIHTSVYPDKSVELLNQSVASSLNDNKKIVDSHVVSSVVSKVVNIPVDRLEQSEKERLLNLGKILHQRVIGQDNAVDSIVKAIKRARVGVRDENKPIASFLFFGPTGVGKTETAKALAEAYYGDEDYMVRIDMSEYKESSSISRLIGGEDGELGVLTSQVRAKPNSLVLLDEIEKASRDIHNLFLQVMDDGRLSDATGSVVDFTNTMIIMTSNVGSMDILKALETSGDSNLVAMDSLKKYFPPEFLNRFTDIITFSPLSKEQIIDITKIKLQSVIRKLASQKIDVEFTDKVVMEIANIGYSKEWGVRPLNRVIEDKVETMLADKIINGDIKAGDKYVVTSLAE